MSLVVIGFIALGVGWLFATPLWQSPDEPAQYLRALSLSQGHLVGPHVPIDPAGRAALREGGSQAKQERWYLHERRGVRVPASLSPPGTRCVTGAPDTSSCEEASYTGDYFPPGYLLPAAAMHGRSTASSALWWARGASLAQTLLFIVLALVLIGPGVATLGLLLAVTPMALFIGAVMNPNGVEIAASLAFLAGLMRWARDPGDREWWAWVATVISGVVAIVSWQLGPVFAACDLIVAALVGGGSLGTLVGGPRARWWTAAGLLIAAVVAFVVYGKLSGAAHSSVNFDHPISYLRAGLRQLPSTLKGAIGDFGSYDVPVPAAFIALWLALTGCLWLAALWVGDRVEKAGLVVALVLALAFPVVFYAFAQRNSGFGLQGRYVLALLALVPVAAGTVIHRHSADGTVHGYLSWVPWAAVLPLPVMQLVAWWVNAHHWAGGGLLLHPAAYSPPGGWWPWAICAILGASAILLGAAPDRPRQDREPALPRGRQNARPWPPEPAGATPETEHAREADERSLGFEP